MANKDYLQQILAEYEVPPADDREIARTVFQGQNMMSRLVRKRTPLWELLQAQMKYISPQLWATQLLVILLGVILFQNLSAPYQQVRQLLFTIMPLSALFAVPELIKSAFYGMSELENVCKNNAAQVMTVRLLVIGCLNLTVITAVTAVVSARYGIPFTEAVLYGLVPFNIVNGFNLFMLDLLQVRSAFIALAASLGVVVTMKLISQLSFFPFISTWIWIILFVGTTLFVLAEIRHLLQTVVNEEDMNNGINCTIIK